MECDRKLGTRPIGNTPHPARRHCVVLAGRQARTENFRRTAWQTGPSVSEALRREIQLAEAQARIAELESQLAVAQQAACRDPLTGALNRRGLEQAWTSELARAHRAGQPLTLALIDLDDFKCINDHFGHAVGDQALISLVDTLRRSLRPCDSICRIGGEEFVVLFPDTDTSSAHAALQRVGATLTATEPTTRLSFSGGLTAVSTDESLESVLERADKATYAAKAAGKRRIHVA